MVSEFICLETEPVVKAMRVLGLRYAYVALLASALLFLGAGSVREGLLTLVVLLAYAAMVESLLHVFDVVPALLLLALVALAFLVSWAYPDLLARAFAAVCVLVSLAVYSLAR